MRTLVYVLIAIVIAAALYAGWFFYEVTALFLPLPTISG